jgi:hypothetical protein
VDDSDNAVSTSIAEVAVAPNNYVQNRRYINLKDASAIGTKKFKVVGTNPHSIVITSN